MERIPITGQDIDWVQQVLVGRPRAGLVDKGQLPRVILRFNFQVVPFFDDLFVSDESPTALITGRREPNCSNRKPETNKKILSQNARLVPLGSHVVGAPWGGTLSTTKDAKAHVQCRLRRFPHEGFRWYWTG